MTLEAHEVLEVAHIAAIMGVEVDFEKKKKLAEKIANEMSKVSKEIFLFIEYKIIIINIKSNQ